MTQLLSQLRIQNEKIQQNSGQGHEIGGRNNLHFNPKVEFPTFDGTDPRDGLRNALVISFYAGLTMSRRWI